MRKEQEPLDIVSHAGWGYALLRPQGKKFAWAGAVAGAAPDLLFFIPSMTERIVRNGWSSFRSYGARNPEIWKADGPPMPEDMVRVYENYYVYTHSFFILLAVMGIVYLLRKRQWLWLALPYAFHILLDIPTHERFQTPFLFPFSRWTIQGTNWGHPWIFFPNWIALISVLIWLRWRSQRKNVI